MLFLDCWLPVAPKLQFNKKEIYNNLDANEDTEFGDTIIDSTLVTPTLTLIEHQYQNIIKLKMNIQIFCVIM